MDGGQGYGPGGLVARRGAMGVLGRDEVIGDGGDVDDNLGIGLESGKRTVDITDID
jgi:hypothetical protein